MVNTRIYATLYIHSIFPEMDSTPTTGIKRVHPISESPSEPATKMAALAATNDEALDKVRTAMEAEAPDWKQACLLLFQTLSLFQETLNQMAADVAELRALPSQPPTHQSDEPTDEEKE